MAAPNTRDLDDGQGPPASAGGGARSPDGSRGQVRAILEEVVSESHEAVGLGGALLARFGPEESVDLELPARVDVPRFPEFG